MEPFRSIEAIALPIAQANLDTDQIIPARFLQKPRSGHLGQYLFHDLRFDRDGGEKPGFLLNQAGYRAAKIIVAAENFGCGSSRENAVWALGDYGFRVVVAPSFGDIFATNCLKNGLLTITLAGPTVKSILDWLMANPGSQMAVDLDSETLVLPDGAALRFRVDPFARDCLLNGLDEIGYTLSLLDKIDAFERRM